MTGPLEIYRAKVASGVLASDAAQEKAVAALQRLYDELRRAGEPPRGWRRGMSRLFGWQPAPVRGLYLWGGVGRGKTFVMDLFFGALPFDDKLRRHFHRFMADVHEHLKELRDRENPLELVADRIAAQTRVICFDEFAINDIADAMILGTLFAALFARGVTLAATSNIEPGLLYKDGLQRQRFLPTIALLRKHCEVLHVDGAIDYRLRVLERADVFQTPNGAAADAHLTEYFDAIAPDEGDHGGALELFGRPIPYRRAADGVIWFDFGAICDGPRSQDDYIELSRLYQTVLVSNVPRFDGLLENQARRFVALVDEFYDRRVKLILSAAAPVAELYRGERLRHDFQRTRSRLEEMQSHDYLASPHRA
ncbi:MAG TPA: cell division protein ZapE [Gammaproteobacteria bacterium]|nr:cell division protein ZapE [Gammaproteobacteria bacterium]